MEKTKRNGFTSLQRYINGLPRELYCDDKTYMLLIYPVLEVGWQVGYIHFEGADRKYLHMSQGNSIMEAVSGMYSWLKEKASNELKGSGGEHYWAFIVKHLPGYYHDDDVLLSNYISKLLNEPDDASEECISNVSQYVDINDKAALISLQIKVDTELFKRALTAYMDMEIIGNVSDNPELVTGKE